MDATNLLSPEAAVGLVIERTGWDHARAGAWLALQVERGGVQKSFGLLMGGTARAPQAKWLPRFPLADLEQALANGPQRSPNHQQEPVRAPAGLEAWYVAEHLRQGYSTREQDLEAARARFGRWTKDSEHLRDLRRKHAPAEWRKPGPK